MLGVVLPRVMASEEVEEGVSAKIFNNGVEAKTRCRFYKTFFLRQSNGGKVSFVARPWLVFYLA
jgi:hypothetical protein